MGYFSTALRARSSRLPGTLYDRRLHPATQSAAILRYAPRNIREFEEDAEDTLLEIAIEADERWMSVHQAKVARLFLVCEATAERLGVPHGMVC